jgi:hypothetical protein
MESKVYYTSGRKHRLTMGDSTMSSYTHRSQVSPFRDTFSSGKARPLISLVLLGWNLSDSSYVSLTWGNRGEKEPVMKKLISSCAFALGLAMGVSACTDPYDPGQRAVGGGLLGASTGAAIGGIAGGGRGAATGALIGGTLGAVGGAATTPSPDYYGYGSSGSGSSGSGYNGYGSYGSRYYGSGYNGYGSYGPQYYGSGYDGAGYYGYGR